MIGRALQLEQLSWRGALVLGLILVALGYSTLGSLVASRSLADETASDGQTSRPSEAVPFERFLAFALANVPEDAAYLFQEPWQYGRAHQLRYALYPRRFERLPIEATEAEVLAFVQSRRIAYILVADVSLYPADSWILQERAWLERLALTQYTFILRVANNQP